MAFSDFKSIVEVSKEYGTELLRENFLHTVSPVALPESFYQELNYALSRRKPNPSEISISESLIFPMIRLFLFRHPKIVHWSREYELKADEKLQGTPDYLFSYTADVRRMDYGMPLVCVAETKIDDFVYAWGQTLAQMLAIQKLGYDFPIFGWATNGITWEFAKLDNNIFVQHIESFSITKNTEEIAGILDWIFTESVRNAEDFLERNKKNN